ncbi:TonB-dependent receptor [Phenylobacterium sp. VNQ135]|uniref:TonB-dependent receptor n=1 Tax=Phenylobacterium sp. VNQ135 TaxID=3400922 RepID=UPI003BFF911B
MPRSLIHRAILFAGAATPLLAAPAWAQEAQIEEVVVTATKRDVALSDVPISVSVVTGKVLEETGVSTLSEIDDYIPNLVISETPSIPIVVMRGIGSSTGSLAFEQNVSMFIDGVYAGRPKQFAAPYFDVDHIEVLRGPQGALVGKNTSAGAIVAVTARPTAAPMARFGLSREFVLQRTQVSGVVSGPLTDRVGARLSLMAEDQAEGQLTNRVTGAEDPRPQAFVGRLVFDYRGEGLDAVSKFEAQRRRIGGQPFQTVSASRGIRFDKTREAGSALGPEFDEIRAENGMVRLDKDLAGHTLTAVSGYSAYRAATGLDSDYYTPDLSYSRFNEDYEQWSQEIRLVSPEGQRFDYIVGLYGQRSDLFITRGTHQTFAINGSNRRYFDQETKIWSAFAEGVLKLTPTLRAKVGLRYTWEDKTASYRQITGAGALGGTAPTTIAFQDARSEELFDPSAVLQWDATPDAMLFLSLAKGSKGGGFQGDIAGARLASFQIKPERSRSLEAGGKFQLLDRRAYLNATAFLTQYENLQLTTIDPNGTGLNFTTRNAGEAESYGVEVETAWRITPTLSALASLAYLHAEFTDFAAGQCALGQPANGALPGTCSFNGVSLPYAPRWNGSASLNWRRPLRDFELRTSLGIRFSDAARYTSTNDPQAVQAAFAKADVRVAIAAPGDRWEMALSVRNLTDERTFSFVTPNPVGNAFGGTGPDGRVKVMDAPRTVEAQLNLRF